MSFISSIDIIGIALLCEAEPKACLPDPKIF